MKRTLLLFVALIFSDVAVAARAEPSPQPLALQLGPPPDPVARARLHRRVGTGLLIGAGACAILGALFVGLAKSANDKALSGNTYHPDQEDRRNSLQIADGVFFLTAGAAFASGMVIYFDR